MSMIETAPLYWPFGTHFNHCVTIKGKPLRV